MGQELASAATRMVGSGSLKPARPWPALYHHCTPIPQCAQADWGAPGEKPDSPCPTCHPTRLSFLQLSQMWGSGAHPLHLPTPAWTLGAQPPPFALIWHRWPDGAPHSHLKEATEEKGLRVLAGLSGNWSPSASLSFHTPLQTVHRDPRLCRVVCAPPCWAPRGPW